ncbi:hypothetical protein TrCOL_g6263 [Triparma columacea]|uniref:Uncharacterized protein n=1 Tax=Triparma columacea TaxID=722753 RepID=A0A9W7L801_9STRA|nr:hypothetical protein TrCOL_g6263 [Triparma columacea]
MSNGRSTLAQTVREALVLFRSGSLTKVKATSLYNKALLHEQAARDSTPVKKTSLSRGSSREIPPARPAVDVQAAALRLSESKAATRRLKSKAAPAKSVAKNPAQAPSSTKSPKKSRANSDPEEYRPPGSSKRRKTSLDEGSSEVTPVTVSRSAGRQARKSEKATELAFGVGDSIIVTRGGIEVSGVIMTVDDSSGKVDIELDSGEQLFGIAAGELC